MGFFGGSRAVLNEMTAAWETARTKRGIGEQRAQMYIGSGGLLRAQYGSHAPITIANLAQPASTAAAVPTGAVFQWVLPVAPVGFLLCDGRVVSTTEYPELFALIGTMFGEGGGGGFRLPNMGGRVPVGAGTPSFPDSFSGSLYVGATGGSPAMEISSINMPEHSHGISAFEHSHTLSSHDHSVTGLVVEAHTHLIDFTTSTAYDVTGNEYTDLSHDHSLDLDLSIYTDGPREYTDEDETSNSQPHDLAHTHTPSVSTNDADDTVTVSSGGDHSHTVVSSGTAASAGAHYHDIASSGGNATITDDGEHSHTVDGLTGSEGEHTHPVIFDGESGTEEDTGHAHTVVSSGTANSAGAHAHDLSSSGGEAIISDDGVHLHSVAINTDTDGAHGHTAIFDAESGTEEDAGHAHTVVSSGTANSAGAHEHDITTTIDDSGDYIVMTDDGTHLHSVAIDTDTDGVHGHTAIFDGESGTESGGTHAHAVSTVPAGAHEHDITTTIDDSGDYIVMTDDGTHLHSVAINTDTDGVHGHTFTGANSGVTGLAGGHSHTLDLDDVGIAFDYDNVSQGRHWDTDITISDTLSVVESALPATADVSGLTTEHTLDTTTDDIPEADVAGHTETFTAQSGDGGMGSAQDTFFYGNVYYSQDGFSSAYATFARTWDGSADWNLAHTHSVSTEVDIPARNVNGTAHQHDIEGSVTINHANSSLGGTDHSHTLNGDIGVATDAGTGAVTGLNAGLVVDSPVSGTTDGIATSDVVAHYHSIAGEISNTDGAHAHDVDGNTGEDTAGHTHTLSGATETNGEHSHAGTAAATWTGGGTSAHTHPLDADSIGATISNTDGAHAHDVDGNTGEDTAGHTHTLSGATETGGAHTHTVNTTGTTAPDGGHAHSIDADSIGATISNTDGAHAHDVDGNTGEDTAGHYHTLSGFTEMDIHHTHTVNTTGTTAPDGGHAHPLDADSIGASLTIDDGHTHDFDETTDTFASHTHTLGGTTETDGAHTHTVNTLGTTASAGEHTHSFDLSDEVVVTNSNTSLDHHHSLSSASAGGTSGSTSLDHYHVLDDGNTGFQDDVVLIGGSLGDSGTLTTDDVIISAGTRTEMEGRAYPERMEVMQPYLVMAFIIKAA